MKLKLDSTLKRKWTWKIKPNLNIIKRGNHKFKQESNLDLKLNSKTLNIIKN